MIFLVMFCVNLDVDEEVKLLFFVWVYWKELKINLLKSGENVIVSSECLMCFENNFIYRISFFDLG